MIEDWLEFPIKKINGAKLVRRKSSSRGCLSASYFSALEDEDRKKSLSIGSEGAKSEPTSAEVGVLKHKPSVGHKGVEGDVIGKNVGEEETTKMPNVEKNFFDRRPFGIPKRYILGAVWCLSVIATWIITRDVRKTILLAICVPILAPIGIFALSMMYAVAMMFLYPLNDVVNEIIPPKWRRAKWYIIIPLWMALPCASIARGECLNAVWMVVAVPIFVFMLIWFVSLFASWILSACEVKNPILKIFAVIGVLLAIAVMIAVGVTSKNTSTDDDYYDQWNRRDPTY